jgi:threonine dehydrogenase-like Zn-dependent dehydrogenase
VGREGHAHGVQYVHDRAMQALRMQTDRPIALREAIMACRSGGTVSVVGVYTGLIDKFPMNAVMNRSLTIKTGQTHVHRYMRPLLERIQRGELDPTFIITHRMPLAEAARGYKIFNAKQEHCEKIVLRAA